MNETYVCFKDLKKNIEVSCVFDNPDDFLKFFSQYNPNTISIIDCVVIFHAE